MIANETKQLNKEVQVEILEILQIVLSSYRRDPTDLKKRFIDFQVEILEWHNTKTR